MVFQAVFTKVALAPFAAPPPMKLARVATIDSLPKSVVGFSKGHKRPRLLPKVQ
jgi:hypothetical protein